LCPQYLNCQKKDQSHFDIYSHLCSWGGSCNELKKKEHIRQYYHFLNHDCPDGPKCTNLNNEFHLATYSHPKIKDIREPCPTFLKEKCLQRHSEDHVRKFSHPSVNFCGVCPVNPLIVNIHALENGGNFSVDFRIPFYENASHQLSLIKKYAKELDFNGPTFQQIVEWCRDLRPVHRIKKEPFLSLLKTAALLSLHQLKTICQSDDAVIPLVLSHPSLRPIFQKYSSIQDTIIDYIRAYTRFKIMSIKLEKQKNDPSTVATIQPDDKVKTDYGLIKKIIIVSVDGTDLSLIETVTAGIATAAESIVLGGIAYQVDQIVGTDRTVFGILGAHIDDRYGLIHVVLQNNIKFHPNFYFLPCAATYFYHNLTYKKGRPWVTEAFDWDNGGRTDFFKSRMHPIAEGSIVWMAAELVGRVAAKEKKKWNQIKLDDLRNFVLMIKPNPMNFLKPIYLIKYR